MVAPLFDLSLRSTQPCVFSAGTSNPDCATIRFADSAETANSPKTARRAFCDRGAVRGRPCTIFPVHVRQTNKHAAGSDAQNEQRRAFGTEARDPHSRRAIEFPRTAPVKPLVLVRATTLFSGCIAHHVAHTPHLRCSLMKKTRLGAVCCILQKQFRNSEICPPLWLLPPEALA